MIKVGILSTHPIQYYSPLYRELANRSELDLTVYYSHRPSPEEQGSAGFGVAFDWDVPLLDGYRHVFLPNIAREPNASSYAGCDTPEIERVIERERFDAFMVHGWYTRSYRQAMRACWRTRTPLMVRGDSTLLTTSSPLKKLLRQISHRRFIPRFDAYLIVGQRAREYYLAHGADPKRMEFSPHFVDNRRFAQGAEEANRDRRLARARWGLDVDQVVFVFSGKFLNRKRPIDFVRAVSQASQVVPMVAGLMIGDGPLREAIECEVRSINAPVWLTGFLNQSEIPTAYGVSDVAVLPSDGSETWGLVINESMACGLPAIVSDRVGCAPDLITDGETGYVYLCGDVDALAERMIRLATNSELRWKMSSASKDRISGYSATAAADGFCSAVQILTRELLAKSESPRPLDFSGAPL